MGNSHHFCIARAIFFPLRLSHTSSNTILYGTTIFPIMSWELDLLEQMRDLNLRMHRLFNDHVRAQGASLAQLKLLLLIDRGGSIRATDITESLGQAPRTVTEAIDTLEREGLVVREPDPKDRRAKRISLTEAGRAKLEAAAPYRDQFAREFFVDLSERERTELLRVLQRLNRRLIAMGAPSNLGKAREGASSGQ